MKKLFPILVLLFCLVAFSPGSSSKILTHKVFKASKAIPFVTMPNGASLCFTDIGGAGCTVGVEAHDTTGALLPLTDTAGVKWPAVTLTIGASASLGLGYGVLTTKPDGTNLITSLPANIDYWVVTCITGTANVPTLAVNTGGTNDGSAGTGSNGYNTGYNPNTSSPIRFFVLDTQQFGRVKN